VPGKPYARVVVEDGGSELVFSNDGMKVGESGHLNRNRYKYANPSKIAVRCPVPGCGRDTKSKKGVCSSCLKDSGKRKGHLYERFDVDWWGHIEGKTPPFQLLARTMIGWGTKDEDRLATLDAFYSSLLESVWGRVPDAASLQMIWEGTLRRDEGHPSPDDLVDMCRRLVDEHFRAYGDPEDGVLPRGFPRLGVRTVAAATCIGYICEEANRGTKWYNTHHPEDASGEIYAGCAMSHGFYLYLRYTGLDEKVARMCLKQ
jgi:hypothetical protein